MIQEYIFYIIWSKWMIGIPLLFCGRGPRRHLQWKQSQQWIRLVDRASRSIPRKNVGLHYSLIPLLHWWWLNSVFVNISELVQLVLELINSIKQPKTPLSLIEKTKSWSMIKFRWMSERSFNKGDNQKDWVKKTLQL